MTKQKEHECTNAVNVYVGDSMNTYDSPTQYGMCNYENDKGKLKLWMKDSLSGVQSSGPSYGMTMQCAFSLKGERKMHRDALTCILTVMTSRKKRERTYGSFRDGKLCFSVYPFILTLLLTGYSKYITHTSKRILHYLAN